MKVLQSDNPLEVLSILTDMDMLEAIQLPPGVPNRFAYLKVSDEEQAYLIVQNLQGKLIATMLLGATGEEVTAWIKAEEARIGIKRIRASVYITNQKDLQPECN